MGLNMLYAEKMSVGINGPYRGIYHYFLFNESEKYLCSLDDKECLWVLCRTTNNKLRNILCKKIIHLVSYNNRSKIIRFLARELLGLFELLKGCFVCFLMLIKSRTDGK